jgi:phosphopantetheinyl transferase (holo-ACP synthase)
MNDVNKLAKEYLENNEAKRYYRLDMRNAFIAGRISADKEIAILKAGKE